MLRRLLLTLVLVPVLLPGCGRVGFESAGVDAGAADAGTTVDAALDAGSTDAGTIDAGTIDAGPVLFDAAPSDPLAMYDDEFSGGPGLEPQWVVVNPGRAQVKVVDGVLRLSPQMTGQWFANDFGVMVGVPISGDFMVTTRVTVTDSMVPAGPLAGPGLEIAALIARDPASVDENRNHVWAGLGADNGSPIIESKSTIASSSVFTQTPIAVPYARLRLCRVGVHVYTFHEPASGGPWEAHETYYRSDLPITIDVGVMATENASPADLTAEFEALQFRTPTSIADCARP